MGSAQWRFNKPGPGARCGLGLLLSFFSSLVVAQLVVAQTSAETAPGSCAVHKTLAVDFTDAQASDVLTIEVSGGPCVEALASVSVTRADGLQVYRYQTRLLDIMPQLIYEPELAQLMSSYVERALHRALLHTTRDLPEYEEVTHYYESTGDFVVIDEVRYEQLRQQNVPILWHKTGEATWVHVIYDPLTLSSQVIMEGKTF